jgi:acyl-CoA synthetase (NDP forming)
VAVIGASRDPQSLGGTLLGNLIATLRGPIYPVNPHAPSIGGLRAFASIREVPGPVDLAFIVVPAAAVVAVARQSVERGVKALVVTVETAPRRAPRPTRPPGRTRSDARRHPLTDQDADELIGESAAARLLASSRGDGPADIVSLRDFLLRVSALVSAVPEIRQADLNPIAVLPRRKGVCVLDARVQVLPGSGVK